MVSVSITEHSIIQVWPDNALISFTPASDERYSTKIAELMNDKDHHRSMTKEEFETAFNNTIKCLTEQYQLSMNMQLDPNNAADQQEADQTTEQVAAQESASQDQAMEVDSEEGSTEG